MKTYVIEIEETVRVNATYTIQARDEDHARDQMIHGIEGQYLRHQDSEASSILSSHTETMAIYEGAM